MRKIIFTALLCSLCLCLNAQKLTRDYHNQSLSKVLEDLNAATGDQTIYFIYDELEDFTVTCHFTNLTLKEAVNEVIGFYPMKVSYDQNNIFVECTQKETTKVIGRLVDNARHPIEFANVSLLSDRDSTFLNGSVSNENGDFVIPCNARRVTVRATCIGYQTLLRSVSVGEIGTIVMQPETYSIDGVVVKGVIPQYKMTTGGMTIEVQHSILHDVGTADDLLSLLPGVQGRDGKFTIMAKGEPEIYINNKKVRDAHELKQLKSVDVKNVEIITAPGAQYNAEVNAVIRIKTLKPQGDGLSLMATGNLQRNNHWSSYDDLTVKYRTGGLEAFANVAFDWGHFSNDEDLDQELHISQDQYNIHAYAPVRTRWTRLQYQTGLSYDFNTDHSVGLSFSLERQPSQHFVLY